MTFNLLKSLWIERNAGFKYLIKRIITKNILEKINLYSLKKEKALQNVIKNSKQDVSIIIAIRNRYCQRIKKTLKSLINQKYDKKLIKIILVDYNSNPKYMPMLKNLCKKYKAESIIIKNNSGWHKSHALNIGIKKAKTKYILSTDVDNIFEKNFIKSAINELKKNPYQVILSSRYNLDKKKSINKNKIRKLKEPKNQKVDFGTNMTLRYYYYKIKGYDEFYKLYAGEDYDLIRRFEALGLNIKNISKKAIFFHQWHEQYEGIKHIKNYKKVIKKNMNYLWKKYPQIIRNKKGWGSK